MCIPKIWTCTVLPDGTIRAFPCIWQGTLLHAHHFALLKATLSTPTDLGESLHQVFLQLKAMGPSGPWHARHRLHACPLIALLFVVPGAPGLSNATSLACFSKPPSTSLSCGGAPRKPLIPVGECYNVKSGHLMYPTNPSDNTDTLCWVFDRLSEIQKLVQ